MREIARQKCLLGFLFGFFQRPTVDVDGWLHSDMVQHLADGYSSQY